MIVPTDPLEEAAAAIADRRAVSTTSSSEGIRLLDRLARLFGASLEEKRQAGDEGLFLWGPLEVRRLLGAGSFGEVFAAWDPTLHREVALKLRNPEVGTLRWLDEARNLARIRHPNVLTVHGADVLDGRAGIWTELISGRTLEEELTATFPEAEAVRIGRDIASALAAVHAAGLVHGDVKTSNIMLEDGAAPRRAVLVDFGAADRAVGEDDLPAYTVGTPLTMAPEVLGGRAPSARSDVYSLGATLFRLVTGHYPLEAASIDELRAAHATNVRRPVRLLAHNVSARFSRTLARAMEADPERRYPSAQAFRRALDDVADPTRRIRARAAVIGAGAAVAAAVAVLAIMFSRPGHGPIARETLATAHDPGILREAWRRPSTIALGGWGWDVAVADLDGDGFDEILAAEARWVGADSSTLGRIHVFRGTAEGPRATPERTINGELAGMQFGDELGSAGDVNADGFEDVLISDRNTGSSTEPSRVRLLLGGPLDRARLATWVMTGQIRDTWFGGSLTGTGDVNRDGFGDVLVGEPLASPHFEHEGAVYLFLGSASGLQDRPAWTATGGKANSQLGGWMRAAGDVNGDGFDDVLLGVPVWDGPDGDCGQARLHLGGATGVDPDPAWTIEGAGPNSHLATFVAGVGDVNGDGYADIGIGEPQYSEERRPECGRVLVFLGGAAGPSTRPDWQALGPVSYMHCGFAVIGVGDLDGDGFDDVAVGSPQYTEGKRIHLGVVEVYRGGRGGCESEPAWRAIGDRPDAHLGSAIWSGDVNGDRSPDLVVGATSWGDSIPEVGLLLAYLRRSAGQ